MITQSITLTADQACTGDGLIVAGDGITIDLGGFTISGDGDPADDGIDVSAAGHVTIKNGTIRHFDVGIASHVGVTELVKVSEVTLRDHVGFGMAASARTVVVDKCSVMNNGVGLAVGGETVKITATVAVGNTNDGVELDADRAKIANLVSTANGGHGFALTGGGARVAVQSSVFARNALGGVLVTEFSFVPGTTRLVKNTVMGNGGDGVRTGGTDDPQHLVKIVVAGNRIEGNAGAGVSLTNDSDGTVVTGNRITGNAADGVTIDATSDATVVKGNTTVGNGASGVATANASAILAKNTANANAGRGISAPGGAIDGRGNTARANGGEACSPAIACPAAFTPKPGPVTPTCGMHVTTSITLGADTPLCTASSNGMFIDADDVTVNLNGHRIHGDRSADSTGISMTQARKHVTIENGIIEGFERGIDNALNSDGLEIVNVEVRDSVLHGAQLTGNAVSVSKSVFVNNTGEGLVLADFATPKVTASFFVGNGRDGLVAGAPGTVLTKIVSAQNVQAGVHLRSSGNGTLQGSIIAANREDGVRIDDTFGVLAPSVVKKSLIVGNQTDGIVLSANSVGISSTRTASAATAGTASP